MARKEEEKRREMNKVAILKVCQYLVIFSTIKGFFVKNFFPSRMLKKRIFWEKREMKPDVSKC
jgi:hypothetical protein